MNYQQLVIKTDENNANLIEEIAFSLSALSVDFSDTFDNPILEPNVGETPLWKNITLKILFAENVDKDFVLGSLQEICNISGEFEFIPSKNWQEECNKNFTTTLYGKSLWICPSWENCENLAGEVIEMDPGMAFGTGSHQTTSLCLEYIANNPFTDKTVLDFGCGSGVLGIAAKKMGASEVVLVDNDPQAIIATENNIKSNKITAKIFHSDEFKIRQFDVVIANILTITLIELQDYLQSLLKTGGKIILSGILKEQETQILDNYSKYYQNFRTTKKDDWVLITADKL